MLHLFFFPIPLTISLNVESTQFCLLLKRVSEIVTPIKHLIKPEILFEQSAGAGGSEGDFIILCTSEVAVGNGSA